MEITKNAIEIKVKKLVLSSTLVYDIKSITIESSQTKDFIFVIAHVKLINSTSLHGYFKYCFTVNSLEVIFKESNLVGVLKFYKLIDCVNSVKKYFAFHNKKLNEL